MLTRRALLMLLAGASLFLILLGPLDVPAAAADTTSRSGALVSRDGSNWPGDPGGHCPVLVVPSRSQGASLSAPSVALPVGGAPIALPAQRPPVLAPPALTIPSSSPVNSGGPVRGAVDVIALSTVLVAATIALVSLVLVRSSG